MNNQLILPPKANTLFWIINNRLALLQSEVDQSKYWNRYWSNQDYLQNLINCGRKGDLGEFKYLIKKYVDRKGLILEAGCGPGHLVTALTENGYDAIGIDYEPEVVEFANKYLPEEKIIMGDVLELDLPDGILGCYLSIGVAEHFIDGPQNLLREARRILKNDGVALISVPYLNKARETLLTELQENSPNSSIFHFHQYYFSIQDFSTELAIAGFEVVEWYPYAVQAFLTREHKLFHKFWYQPLMRYAFQKRVLRILHSSPRFIRRKYGHMVMFVCRPI